MSLVTRPPELAQLPYKPAASKGDFAEAARFGLSLRVAHKRAPWPWTAGRFAAGGKEIGKTAGARPQRVFFQFLLPLSARLRQAEGNDVT